MKATRWFQTVVGTAVVVSAAAACHQVAMPGGAGTQASGPAFGPAETTARLRRLSSIKDCPPPPTGCEAGIPFSQGFEADTAGWNANNGATVTRVLSGSTGTAYAPGISASEGTAFARLSLGAASTCASGGGPQNVQAGPFTQWGCYGCEFPTGGYDTTIAIYLDVAYAIANPDTRFDWSSAINGVAGTGGTCSHRRDFTFNAGSNATGFVISASTNATRCGANPADPGRTPVQITQSGWYTFRTSFDLVAGQLVVTSTITRQADNVVAGTWVVSEPTDVAALIGGNRYGWFVSNEFPDLAIDLNQRVGGQCCDN